MKKTWIVLLALLLLCSMLFCACDDLIPETDVNESEQTSEESKSSSENEEKPEEEPKEEELKEEEPKEEEPKEEEPKEEDPVIGETLTVTSMKMAYSELGLVYTGYADDGRIAAQTFLRESMQYEQNVYVEYGYDTKGRVICVTIYQNVDGYVLSELYRLDATYVGDSKTTASVKYYEQGELLEDAAKITYHENGVLSFVWFGEDDDCDLMLSFDEQGRFLTCAYDQEWGSYVMKYGTGANPEQLEMYSGNDGSLEGAVDLTYTGDLLTMLLVEHDGGSSKIEYAYDTNKVLTRVTTTVAYVGQDRTMKTVAAATLDENSRIIVRETARYQSDVCAGKTVESFVYDENGRVIQKETKHYADETTVRSTRASSWKYDAEGRVLEHTQIDYDAQGQQTAKSVREYTYNAMGKVTMDRTTRYNSDGDVDVFGKTYIYDEQGNLLETKDIEENIATDVAKPAA